MTRHHDGRALQRLLVFHLRGFGRIDANGRAIGADRGFVPGDVMRLEPDAVPIAAELTVDALGRPGLRGMRAAGGFGVGVRFEASLWMSCPDGEAVEFLVLSDRGRPSQSRWILPVGQLRSESDYTLVTADLDLGGKRFGEIACPSLARGTHVSLSTGRQVPVERLKAGDKVLTRDGGPQQIRWIGRTTRRGAGPYAPVRIKAGTLSNTRDLIVSPNHRLLVYQRQDRLGLGGPEVLVQAEALVDGSTVLREDTPHVDYFHILLDGHEVIYAEGIGCETLAPGPISKMILPGNLQLLVPRSKRRAALPGVDVAANEPVKPDLLDSLRAGLRG